MTEPETQKMPLTRAPTAQLRTPKHVGAANVMTPPTPPRVRDPRGTEDGALLVDRAVSDEDLELLQQVALDRHTTMSAAAEEYLTAFGIEVAAAGGTCVDGPVMVRLTDPAGLRIRARVAPVAVAERLGLPAPAMLTPPGGITTVASLRPNATPRATTRAAEARRRPRWAGRLFWIVLAALAVAMWGRYVPLLRDTAVMRQLAQVPTWTWLLALTPWLWVPARHGWRALKRSLRRNRRRHR